MKTIIQSIIVAVAIAAAAIGQVVVCLVLVGIVAAPYIAAAYRDEREERTVSPRHRAAYKRARRAYRRVA